MDSTKATVYLETTVVSYIVGRASRDILVLGHQEISRRWWDECRQDYHIYASPSVVQEAERGDPSMAAKRMEILRQLELLAPAQAIQELANGIMEALYLPPKASFDALHIAFAVYYEVDYLLTWNCAHIANGRCLKLLSEFALSEGMWFPIICTPEEMVGRNAAED